ncbi:hypothetical protein [Bifidobacterium callitrichidarum]|uniref:hypothetical protein n=1 Tax=Bifidobacterium callitrichidarum TaxID=2052941 RepID=UPI0011B20958|nr:hypothetical protein [Bifidobacterium callitrichidarum]
MNEHHTEKHHAVKQDFDKTGAKANQEQPNGKIKAKRKPSSKTITLDFGKPKTAFVKRKNDIGNLPARRGEDFGRSGTKKLEENDNDYRKMVISILEERKQEADTQICPRSPLRRTSAQSAETT